MANPPAGKPDEFTRWADEAMKCSKGRTNGQPVLANPSLHAKLTVMAATKTPRRNVKRDALKLVRTLPAASSWDDLMYRIYVRQKIETGLTDLDAGRSHTHAEIRKEFGLG
jgi:hypothetical protein